MQANNKMQYLENVTRQITMQTFVKQLGEIWYILLAIVTMAWYLAMASADIQTLKISDTKQDTKLEAINNDITQIKVDTSYIRARIDGQIPPQRLK